MWKLKVTYFYVKFFYLIFNKLWKPDSLCLSVCFPLKGKVTFYTFTFSNFLSKEVKNYFIHWFHEFRTQLRF